MPTIMEMRQRPLGERAEATRIKLLEKMRELLDEKPLHHVTISEVARRAKVSPATFHAFFTFDEALEELMPEAWSPEGSVPFWEAQVANAVIAIHHARAHTVKGTKRIK